MSYSPPAITAAGLSVPSFSDIQSACLFAYQTIWGSTTYLGNDSADYQWVTALTLKLSDNCSLCQLAYNSRSPLTAIGAALDSVGKLTGGVSRIGSTASIVVLTLTGTPGQEIDSAVIQDINGILWSLPAIVLIGSGGTVNVSAVCQQSGPVSAAANTITVPVGGFTTGWTGVTNANPAVVGTPTESDSTYRARQSISQSLPSETRLAATQAGLEQVPGVTRVNVLENQLSVTDSFGNEGHSLTCVVEGGTDQDVAMAIFINRGIGPNTQGATVPTMTVINVTDPNSGNVTAIGFVRPVDVPIFVKLSVHGLTLAFTTSTQQAIIAALVSYLNTLAIGEIVTLSALYAVAMSINTNINIPTFSIRALTLGFATNPSGTSDLTLEFFQVAEGLTANIALTVV